VCEGMDQPNLPFLSLNHWSWKPHAALQLHRFTAALLTHLCCAAAQRQIGETNMNETSSRSHQILRLVGSLWHWIMICIHLLQELSCFLNLLRNPQTVESSARQFLGRGNSSTLVACVVWNSYTPPCSC
jgi:hypothetical protein